MSYDLMVFNPQTAPKSEVDFLKWSTQQIQWKEEHSYDNIKVTSLQLQNWFMEMIKEFPAINGPHAPSNIEDIIDANEVTDYSIGKDVIYAAFKSSISHKAYSKMLELAEKHNVGFYDISNTGKIYRTDNHKNYRELKAIGEKILTIGGDTLYDTFIKPSWTQISNEVAKIDGNETCFLILENEIGDYMQCLGNKKDITIEYRFKTENSFSHVVLGTQPTQKQEITITTSTGDVTVFKNETFNPEELLNILQKFYKFNSVDKVYNYRER